MEPPFADFPLDEDQLLLGVVLGQSQMSGHVAGRCSAARAEALLRLREEKLYLRCAPSWQDFCPRFLHMSRKHADSIIRLWQEFGAGFFELAQLTRISAQTYRAIEPAIRDGAFHCHGETLAFDPENSRRIAAAVHELRRAMPARTKPTPNFPPPNFDERLAGLEKRCADLASEFASLAGQPCPPEDRARIDLALTRAADALRQIAAPL